MKKRVLGVVGLAFLACMLIAGPASAAIVSAGDSVKFNWNINHDPLFNGGIIDMFKVTALGDVPAAFTFCLERGEGLGMGPVYHVDTISLIAVAGGAGGRDPILGGDPLSQQSAYLYKLFMFGALPNFDITDGADQKALQQAFWYLENEINSVSGKSLDWVNLAGSSPSDFNHVRVLNPIAYDANGAPILKQSVLYYVPEPGTLGMLSFGMTALAFISRRRSARK